MPRCFTLACFLLLSPTAFAQQPAAPAAAPVSPAADAPPALSGPRVREAAAPAGIVALDFNGKVRRPETTPEEAATALLELDDAVRTKVRAIFDRRASILDSFVVENLDLLTKFGAAAGGNDKLDQLGLGMEAFQKLAPLREGGSLWDQVAAALPEGAGARFEALMRQYWDAVTEEGKQKLNDKGKVRTRFEIVIEERLGILGREIEQSFNRQLYSGGLITSYFTTDINLTESQRARVRQMTLDFAHKTNLKPTEEQQQKLVIELLSILDQAQREKVAKKLGL